MPGKVLYRKAAYRAAYNRPWCADYELADGEAFRGPWSRVNGYTDFPEGWSNGPRRYGSHWWGFGPSRVWPWPAGSLNREVLPAYLLQHFVLFKVA